VLVRCSDVCSVRGPVLRLHLLCDRCRCSRPLLPFQVGRGGGESLGQGKEETKVVEDEGSSSWALEENRKADEHAARDHPLSYWGTRNVNCCSPLSHGRTQIVSVDRCTSLTSKRDCVNRDYCVWDQGTRKIQPLKYPITSADIAFTVGSLLCELYTAYRLMSVAFLPTSCHVVSSGTRILLWSALIYTQCMTVCDILVYKKCWIKVRTPVMCV